MIYAERDSQKGIIIGHGGKSLKKVGTEARKDLEAFFEKKVFLELFVKVEKDWRNKDTKLKGFGYKLESPILIIIISRLQCVSLQPVFVYMNFYTIFV